MREIILYLSIINNNEWEKISLDLKNLDFTIDWNKLYYLKSIYENEYITFLDSNYPDSLKLSPKAPFLFYFYGNIDLLKTEKIWLKGKINRLESHLNLRKILSNFKNDFSKSLILDENSDFFEMVKKNIFLNKIIFLTSNNMNVDQIDDRTLVISLEPIDKIKFNNKIEKKIDFFKSQLMDKIVFLNTEYSTSDLRNIIDSLKNNKKVYAIEIEDKYYKNNLLIKNGASPIKNLNDI